MTKYIITATVVDIKSTPIPAKFSLEIKDSHMADVFTAVERFGHGENVTVDERTFNGYTYATLETLIADNSDSFIIMWLGSSSGHNLSVENIATILTIS